MATTSPLSKYPVLRILLPFIAGILLYPLCHSMWVALASLIVSTAVYCVMELLPRSPMQRLQLRSRYALPLCMMAMSLGWMSAILHDPPQLDHKQLSDRVVTGRVVGLSYTDFSMRLTVELIDKEYRRSKVLLSTQGCDYTMNAGDVVTWQASLNEVRNAGNPGEMDYAGYLLDSHGIRYEQHLTLRQLHVTGHSPTLITRMASLRRQLQQQLFNTGMTAGAQHFAVALLLGNSRVIDPSTRQAFSSAGVAHVLALSGLHVGFIALIIWFLLFPLDYLGLRNLRLVLTLVTIVWFAIFTGLSPSVVRATVMIGFAFTASVFYRRSVSVNALAMAALVILVFSPMSLYSVGFQLSFITVLAVLLFGRVPESLQSRHHWLNAITAMATTSAVAMLATIALTAHYFHTVSLMSILSNLLILPVMPLFMVLGGLLLLVTASGQHWPLLDWAVEMVYRYIHWSASTVNAIPLSHVQGVYVSTTGVVIYFIALALLGLWIYRRRYRYLLWCVASLATLWIHSTVIDHTTPRHGVVVFNSFTSTPVLYYDNGKGYVWTPDEEETDSATFARYYAGFLARHNIHELQFITTSDSVVRLDGVLFKPPHAHLMGRRWLAAGSGKWRHMTSPERLALDNIIVTKRFHGTATKLRQLYHFDQLIISGAMHASSLDPLVRECDSIGIPYHNLSQQGAYLLSNPQKTGSGANATTRNHD